jgi:hypothetical protein
LGAALESVELFTKLARDPSFSLDLLVARAVAVALRREIRREEAWPELVDIVGRVRELAEGDALAAPLARAAELLALDAGARGEIGLKREAIDTAARLFERLAAGAPSYRLRASLNLAQLARAKREERDAAGGLQAVNAALSHLDDSDRDTRTTQLCERARCLLVLGSPSEALVDAENAVRIRRELVASAPAAMEGALPSELHVLAQCLVALGRRAEARASIDEARGVCDRLNAQWLAPVRRDLDAFAERVGPGD